LNERGIIKKTQELFERMNITSIDPHSKLSDLTVGKQQLVEIAKAISYDSRVIVFDEPTATLTDTETDVLFKLISELKQKDVAMIYISHRMDEIKRISDRVTVLRDGEFVGTRDTADVEIDEIIQMMIGRVTYEQPKEKSQVAPDAPVVLKVEGLTSKDVDNVSFELRKGEILGFAGLMGAGRTEIARLIFGADKKTGGDIFINGEKVDIRSPGDAVRNGIGYLSEDRKRYGCVLGMRVADNVVLPSLAKYVRGLFLNEKKISRVATEYVEKIDIRTPTIDQMLKNLSGGNQQKVIIAKWLIRNCDILIFDEPTRGIDVGAKSEIYKLMNTLVKEGKSIIMISSELSEIFRMSDRIMVMSSGVQTATLTIEEADQHMVMKHAVQYSHLINSVSEG
jgi:ribose transport system ATP-binding protein